MLDVAIAEYGTGMVSVLLGKGDGTFATSASYTAGDQPQSAATADFNGDGKLDLAVANGADDTVSILLGNGDGTFEGERHYSTASGPIGIAVGDFNQDGALDLAVDNLNVGTVSILLGNADGTFATGTDYATGMYSQYVSTADLNRDGYLDLVTANYGDGTVSILLGNGDGTFSPKTDIAGGSQPVQVSIADFNNDGKADLAVANSGSGEISVFLGKGDATFQPKTDYPVGAACYFAGVGDFNGDGIPDLAGLVDTTKVIRTLLGRGDGTFAAQSSATIQDSLSEVVGDFDGDGLDDLIVTNYYYESISTYLTKLAFSAKASANGLSLTGAGAHAVVANYVGDNTFLPSASAPASIDGKPISTMLSLSVAPVITTFGTQQVLTATLSPSASQGRSSDGDTVTFMGGKINLGPAPLTSGVATLTTTSVPIGSDVLSAVFSGDNNFAGSSATTTSTVTAPTDFLFVSSGATTETVEKGSRTTFDFALDHVSSFHSYPSEVTFAVTGLPAGATYEISPNTVSQTGGAQTVTLTVQTASSTARRAITGRTEIILACTLFLLPLARKSGLVAPRWIFLALILGGGSLGVAGLSGCGRSPQMSAENYTVSVIASSGTVQHAVRITLGIL